MIELQEVYNIVKNKKNFTLEDIKFLLDGNLCIVNKLMDIERKQVFIDALIEFGAEIKTDEVNVFEGYVKMSGIIILDHKENYFSYFVYDGGKVIFY